MKRRLMAGVGLVFLFTLTLSAQEPAGVATAYRPGDKIRIVVTLKTPAQVRAAAFECRLDGQAQQKQERFNTIVSGSEMNKLSDTEYEIAGEIRPNNATGFYRLSQINLTVEGGAWGGVDKPYQAGADFETNVRFRVNNPAHVIFPEIKDAKIKP